MNETEACKRLPPAYARALRLRRERASRTVIAEALGIRPEAVEPLLRVADAKLAALMGADAATRPTRRHP